MKRVIPVLIAFLVPGCRAAQAGESGTSNYLPGFQDVLAGVQTIADTGPGATLGPFRGQTYALGLVVNYNIGVGKVPLSFTGKYYGEFGVSNRFEGDSYWLNISASF